MLAINAIQLNIIQLHIRETTWIRKVLYLSSCSYLFDQGSPLNRTLLRAINIHLSTACVVLSAKNNFMEDSNLIDKETILCSLNIQALLYGRRRLNIRVEGLNYFARVRRIVLIGMLYSQARGKPRFNHELTRICGTQVSNIILNVFKLRLKRDEN